jgi:hypothetical protein
MMWCSVCDRSAKTRQRELSPGALKVLLEMGQIEPEAVGRPMCDECFDELRDILIEAQADASPKDPALVTEAAPLEAFATNVLKVESGDAA